MTVVRSCVVWPLGLLILAMVATSPVAGAASSAERDAGVLPEFVYSADRDAAGDVALARQAALRDGKLMLLAFGAQWCHDSRGLARNFSDPSLLPMLRERFEIVFIDLGYYDNARALFQSFGMPVFFGTPTVLVIDPMTERILNEDTLAQWQAADSVPMAEYHRYFGREFTARPAPDAGVASALTAIRKWEQGQAERLYSGYDRVGPMLAAEAAGDTPSDINEVWAEVREFRVQLQKDLVAMRAAARSGERFDENYDWPTYAPFSWEQ